MLSYKFRFHGHNSIRNVYRRGGVVRGNYWTLKYLVNDHRSSPRIAIVVSRKVCKSAVGRNRIRRRLYEKFRLLQMELKQNIDIACIVTSSEVREMPDLELSNLLHEMIIEADLYKKS